MKFLPSNMEGKNLMPIHVHYSRGTYDGSVPDVLDFIYKDLDTGKKYVESIQNPVYEVWVVKPEYRNYTHIKNFIKKDQCTCHRIHYKNRYNEAARILGLRDPKSVKCNPYIFQLDIQIEHFYLLQFKIEYGNDVLKKPSVGYLDIESDMFQSVGKIMIGADPINCISFLHGDSRTMYTAILRKDNIPHVDPSHKKYEVYEKLRKSFYEQVEAFESDIKNFIEELHSMFDASYGVMDYQIYMFDSELELISFIFEAIRVSSPDYWLVWNLPYDEQQMIERIKILGGNPMDIIADPEMRGLGRENNFYFKEDKNPKPHKRRHISSIYMKSIPVDQLPVYGGIRVAKGSLQSYKLNQVAKNVLNDEKLDYSEYGNFKYFPYENFRRFIIYNIKDVLLQYGLEELNGDMMFVADVVCNDCVLNHEIFTTTVTETQALRDFAWRESDSIMGNNKAKMDLPEPKFSIVFEGGEDYNEEDFMWGDEHNDDDEESGEEKKKEKFSGAYVMSPGHIKSSGSEVMGKINKYVHSNVIDEDITSEYPTQVMISNCTNETLVGKVFLLNPDDVKIPFCSNFRIIDAKDEETYSKIKSSAWVMELWSQRDVLSFGEVVLNLPSPTTVLSEIGDDLDFFMED